MPATNSGASALGGSANTRTGLDSVQENQADPSHLLWLLLFYLWGSVCLGQASVSRRHSPGGGLAKSGDRLG